MYHVTANDQVVRRSYLEVADRARGLAYYLKNRGYRRVGILCPNTPAFLESIFGIAAAGAVNVGMEPLQGLLQSAVAVLNYHRCSCQLSFKPR